MSENIEELDYFRKSLILNYLELFAFDISLSKDDRDFFGEVIHFSLKFRAEVLHAESDPSMKIFEISLLHEETAIAKNLNL